MSVTPQFIGQRYKDTANGNIWIANSVTPGDWTLEIQNYKMGWLPITANFQNVRGFENIYILPGITDLIDLTQHTLDGYKLNQIGPDITRFYCPNLIDIDPSNVYAAQFSIQSNDALQVIELPLFQRTGFQVFIDSNPALTTVLLQSLISVPSNITIRNNPLLTSINLASWIPLPGEFGDFTNNALAAATVNQILHRGVASTSFNSGGIDTSGGTNAAPTGQGIVDKVTLNLRSPGLAVTN